MVTQCCIAARQTGHSPPLLVMSSTNLTYKSKTIGLVETRTALSLSRDKIAEAKETKLSCKSKIGFFDDF
jgi:hypothetical protein